MAAGHPHQQPAKVLGKTVHRAGGAQSQVLPFTGPSPVAPMTALGVLLLAGGAWMLARWPQRPAVALGSVDGQDATLADCSSVTVRSPRNDGAIERLRSVGHQLARPSNAATDGTSSERTTNVSSSNPAVIANPVS